MDTILRFANLNETLRNRIGRELADHLNQKFLGQRNSKQTRHNIISESLNWIMEKYPVLAEIGTAEVAEGFLTGLGLTSAKRGGKRPGAGAKPRLTGELRVRLSVSVSPETREKIDDYADEQDVSHGVAVDDLVRKGTEKI